MISGFLHFGDLRAQKLQVKPWWNQPKDLEHDEEKS